MVSFALLGMALAPGAARAATEIGRIAVVSGDVKIAKGEADKGRAAQPNDAVFNDDVIKTGDSGAAKVLFTDQSLMDVGPSSALKVSDYALKDGENRTGTFSMLYGKLRALITQKVGDKGKVEVKTGDAVMGVRGTEFLVESPRPLPGFPSPGTQVVVVSGLVAVRPPAGGPAINVGAGQMIVANPKAFSQAAAGGGSGSSESKESKKEESKSEAKSDGKGGGKGEGKADLKLAKADAGGEGKGSGGGDAGGNPVVKVSAEQMKSAVSTAKVEDNTFVSAVQITPVAGGGTGGSMASATVGNIIATGVQLPPPPSESGTALIAPPPIALQTNFLPPVSIVPGNQVHLSVNVQ